jgi:hypothetical protein
MTAHLVTVTPERQDNGDLLITREALEAEIDRVSYDQSNGNGMGTALIVRTLPNDENKLSRVYDGENIPAYFSTDVMELIVERGYEHLLVDLPSIDRLFDEGRLANHRTFWRVAPDSFETQPESRVNATITELIFVPPAVQDGRYVLNLQIAPFSADAAPSRPVIWPLSF